MPVILVRFEELVGLFVSEEVEDEGSQGRSGGDGFVENAGVGGGGDGIGGFREAGDGGEDVVAERGGEEAVGEGVEV